MRLVFITAGFFATLLYCQASEVALLIGGFGSSDASQVITKDGHCLGSQSSPVIPKAPDGRIGWSAQYVDGKILLCGGAKDSFYRDCWDMTIGGRSWTKMDQSMVYQKRYAESLVFNGEMYVLGGYNLNQGWLDAIERRDKTTGQWSEVWTLPRKIFDLCAVVHDNKIIVLGGNMLSETFDSVDMDILDTATGTWSKGPSMTRGRATHDCMVTEYNGQMGIMVTGGCSENCQFHLNDVSFFSFDSQTWSELPPLNDKRMGHKLINLAGKPTVISGFDPIVGELGTIEVFDGNQWTVRDDEVTFPVVGFGAPDEIPDNVTC